MMTIKISKLASEFKMDSKDVISTLASSGLVAKRSNSSVDADKARALLSGGTVVSLNAARNKAPAKAAKAAKAAKTEGTAADRKLAEFYSKYPHVVSGSVREPTASDKKSLGAKCHGKVCDIKCMDSAEKRTINTQDAFQVKRTEESQLKYLRRRRAERRTEKKEKKQAQNG